MSIDISKFQFEEFISTPDGVTFYFTGPKDFLPNPIIEAAYQILMQLKFLQQKIVPIMIGLIFVQIVWMLKKFKVF